MVVTSVVVKFSVIETFSPVVLLHVILLSNCWVENVEFEMLSATEVEFSS